MISIRVLFFATLRDRVGEKEVQFEVERPFKVAELRQLMEQKYPAAAPLMKTALASVNREFAFDGDLIPAGAEVAFFPPVSGGANENAGPVRPTIFRITDETLDLNRLIAEITLPSSGAACVFTGMVRGVTSRDQPHETVYLEYEAYKPMAEAKIRQVVREIRERWPAVEGIAIVQRVGRLYPQTPTVLIACTAAHRDTGVFEAARYGIDRLKEIVPVWKKEVGPQGETWVEGEYIPDRGD